MSENTVAPGPVPRNRTGDEPDKPGPSGTTDRAEGRQAEQLDRSGPADEAAGAGAGRPAGQVGSADTTGPAAGAPSRPEPAGADHAAGEPAGQAGVAGQAARKAAEESGRPEPAGAGGEPVEQPGVAGQAAREAAEEPGRPEPAGADRAAGEPVGQAGVAGQAARKAAEEPGRPEPAGTGRVDGQPGPAAVVGRVAEKPGGQPEGRGPAGAPGTEKPAVEMPAGLDRTPTEPIPAGGDISSQRRDYGKPAGAPTGRGARPNGTQDTTVFDEATASGFRARWRELQADFVDDPSRAVRNADGLVDEIMRELVKRKDGLEERWRDGPGDTEKLRVALTEYRSFFDQLLNARVGSY